MSEEIEQLKADVEVLRAYVQGLLAFVPKDAQSMDRILSITRQLNAASAQAEPGRKEALDLAVKRMSAPSFLSIHGR